jgi:hypothetical protein
MAGIAVIVMERTAKLKVQRAIMAGDGTIHEGGEGDDRDA